MNAALHAPVGAGTGETVFDVLAERAKLDSERRLVAYLLGGVIAASLIVLGVPGWWPLAGFAAAMAAFGTWGLLGKGGPSSGRGVRVLRTMVAAAGTFAAILFVLGLFLVSFTGDTTSPYGHGKRSPRLTGPDTAYHVPAELFR